MKAMLMRCLVVGAAGFFGAIARYLVTLTFGRINIRFPMGTFVINITGSFFLGWFVTYAAPRQVSDLTRLAIGVGFVGAYTTFSTFMHDSARLYNDGAQIEAMVNLIASLVLGLAAVQLGMMLGRQA